VTNVSDAGIEIHNLSVVDTNFTAANPGGVQAFDLSSCFPTSLGVAGSSTAAAECDIPATTICDDTLNIVTATGNGFRVSDSTTLQTVSAKDTNNVTIVPFEITCTKEVSTNLTDWANSLVVPDGFSGTVYFRVIVDNSSSLPLVATINDTGLGGSCATNLTADLPAHGSITNVLCSASVVCPPGTNNTVTVTAIVDVSKTNICVCTTNNTPVRAETTCEASVTCVPASVCRVTGGGRQDVPLVCPDDVRYVTHGGQVGAPVGDKVCFIDTNLPNFFLGNPCIHGRWTHVRHVQGGLEGNFHARFFDTLDCACLDTNLGPNCQYGPETVVNGVCGDRSTGPLPRPAPANKIAFTGVGDWACPNGRREPRACLFRVDIEDRGEPGNAHALAANGKPNRVPDRYRIRIWVLDDNELAELNGAGPDKWLLNFRNCISACNGIDFRDGVSCAFTNNTCASADSCTSGGAGRISFGNATCSVRLPNIDDGGELLHGNHQIHPQIKNCDPFNPTGPGLAKP
jgi:hypothetical protein